MATMNQNPQDDFLVSKGKAYYIFILVFLLYAFDFADRQVIASLFPYLKKDWGLTDTQCGLLSSIVYWFFVVLVIPFSVIMDRWSRKKMIGMMAVTWSLATIACAFTKNFGQLFAARGVIGVGEAAYAPGGVSMIAGIFPQRSRATMLGILNMAVTIGSAFGVMAGGYIAVHYGWRHAFGIVGIPGLLIAILIFFVRDYKPVKLEVDTGDSATKRKMSKKEIVRQFTRSPSLILNYFGHATSMLLAVSMITWLPTFLNRIDKLPMESATAKTGIFFFIIAIGTGTAGWVGDKWQKRRANARALVPAITSVIWAVVTFTAFYFVKDLGIRYLLILVSGLFGGAFVGFGWTLSQDLVHPGLRATSGSLNGILMHFLGSALGPLIVGIISDRYDLKVGMSVISVTPLMAAACWFTAAHFYVRDLARVETVALEVDAVEPEPKLSPKTV
jgi:MFS family permease